MKTKYDIFVSYRRDGGAQYARILQLELEKRGYRVFLDYDELTDGIFSDNLREAIVSAPIFILILSAHCLVRCKEEQDWVRLEIMLAKSLNKHFIPINPDDSFDGIPDNIPDDIKQIVESHQHWNINFGQLLSESVNLMVNSQVKPIITPPSKNQIFVSYSRHDKNVVFPFVEKLNEELHLNCWIDLEGIESGEQFEDVIIHAIDSTEIVLFMLSDNSLNSDWTKREVYYAEGEKKRIVPVVIDRKGLRGWFKFHFGNVDYIDVFSEEQCNKLYNDLLNWVTCKDYSYPQWRNVKVPEGARGTIVAFDVNGEWEKHIFSSDDEKNKYRKEWEPKEEKVSKDQSSKNREASINSQKSRLKYWIKVLLIVFVLVATITVGLIAFNKKGNAPEGNIEAENVQNDNIGTICRPIDMGLPSGTLWGDRNIGAKNEADFGMLYAWGENSTKKDYSQGMYDSTNKPKSNIILQKNDVATTILGDDWEIPSEKQYRELLNECQWKWIQIKGHYGYEITGKNGNKIFLPAAGWICSTKPDYQNKYGYYWTSERVTSNPQFARSLQFPKDGKGIIGNGYLYYGRSVRAVYKSDAVAE